MKRSIIAQNGFTLIELMIVMVITSVVLGATFSLMAGTMNSAKSNYELTSASQEFRISQEFINRDLLTLGNGLIGVSSVWIPTEFVSKYISTRPLSELDPTGIGYVKATSSFSDNNVPANVGMPGVTPEKKIATGSDRFTMLATDNSFSPVDVPVWNYDYADNRVWINPGRIADFQVGEIYYFTSGSTGIFATVTSINAADGWIQFAEGDASKLNKFGWLGNVATGTNRGSVPSILKRVSIITYFIDTEHRLVRRVWGVKGAAFVENVVSEHVLDLQFKFVMAPSDTTVVFEKPADQVPISSGNSIRLIKFSTKIETANALAGGEKQVLEGSTTVGVRNIQFLEAPVPRDSSGNTALPNPQPTPVITPTPPPPPPPTPTPPPSPSPTPTTTPPPGTPTPVPPLPTPTPVPPPPPPPTPTPTPTPTPLPGDQGNN